MQSSPLTTAPVSVTTETIVFQRTTVHSPPNNLVPFVARVHRVKTRRGKDYSVLRLTIPKEAGESIGIASNELLFLMAQKAEWYHMIDWSEMKEAWARLPNEMKSTLQYFGLVSMSPAGEIVSLTGSHRPAPTEVPAGPSVNPALESGTR